MFRKSYTYKALKRALGTAVHRYDMISDGDRIAIGLSGGQDSLSLLAMLKDLRARAPVRFELFAIHIDPGFAGGFDTALEKYCGENDDFLRLERTDFGLRAHSAQNRENPCFLCSRLRRRRLFEIAEELGCRKLALGHNKDDIIETLFLNICYAGEISTMVPSQSFFGGKFRIIRPFAFADEKMIRRFAQENRLPRFINPCPTAGVSKRREIKTLLNELYRKNRKIKGNIFRAMSHVNREYLLQ